ncbi:methionine synthase [Spirochaetia bacterium]|nr:methionine synthase [Spirochaetia bacterium]
MTIREQLDEIAAERILILDGAMGSMIQTYKLKEGDFRGERFAAHPTPILGCNDLLCITKPEVISGIHEAYLAAGADIIETCSLNSTAVSLADYGLADLAYEISAAAAQVARKAADKFSTPGKPRFVAGSIGPTTRSGSISPDMDDPGKRGVTWDELEAAYYDNARGLLDGGADILLAETLYDTLNAKAAAFAINRLLEECHIDVPLILSATVSDTAGRLLSGQTVEAFWVSVAHAKLWAVGLNCSFGAEKLKPHIAALAAAVSNTPDTAPCKISAYPNAGLPNQLGDYDEGPKSMAAKIEEYLKEGLVNIVGGCCGSTPAHITEIAAIAKKYAPRKASGALSGTVETQMGMATQKNAQEPSKTGIPSTKIAPGNQIMPGAFLAGLEPLRIGGDLGLTDIGERTNVAGSRKFLRLIKEEKYNEALGLAREMIEGGAAVIDVCMDDALLDAEKAMKNFLNLALSDPDIARVPFMIDSSRWNVIEGALKCVQGKCLVNSISLKEGEAEFLRKLNLTRRYGAAVVVMLFDEQGQAAGYERKIEVARRSWELITGAGFPPTDIVFDPNVLSVATGISEHDSYALDFIRACEWIRGNCPGAQISGGISNLSFSFRGNETVREAMHAVFIKHAVDAGLTMAILNPASLVSYDDIEPALRAAAEDVILNRSPGASEKLLALAVEISAQGPKEEDAANTPGAAWRSLNPEERIVHAMVKGIDDFIEADVLEIRPAYSRSLEIVEGPLMKGMREVGDRFGAGKMFLPQVIRSARVMKKAVAVLEPFIAEEKVEATAAAKVLLATVKGDVHDIGKNIVGVVLGCNGYDIIDLGVMVPTERIIETAVKEKVSVIGLSGLITPSLDEMVRTVRELENRGLKIPLIIGGATTSLAHTALRIAPEYSGPVVYTRDAGQCPAVVRALLSETERPRFLEELAASYSRAAARHEAVVSRIELLPLEEARANRIPSSSYIPPAPKTSGIIELNDYPLEKLIPRIDWNSFLQTWEMAEQTYPNALEQGDRFQDQQEVRNKLLGDARNLLDKISTEKILRPRGVAAIFPAASDGDDIVLYSPGAVEKGPSKNAAAREIARFSFLRNQDKKRTGAFNPCLADFIPPAVKEGSDGTAAYTGNKGPAGWIGLFALSAGFGLAEAAEEYRRRHDDYSAILLASLTNSLAEAFSEEVHQRVAAEFWGYAPAGSLSAGNDHNSADGTGGIRPAFGYPACPDHKDKETAFALLEAQQRCGLALTPSAMIDPAASVCGMYIVHPGAYYFGIGTVGDDQLSDWAARKGISGEEARRRVGRI